MKLWKKIALLCCAVLCICIALAFFLMYQKVQRQMLENAHQEAEQRIRRVESAFEQMMIEHHSYQDPPAVKRSLLRYCFQQSADGTAVLTVQGEDVVNSFSFSPSRYLPLVSYGAGKEYRGAIDGREYYIRGSTAHLPGYADTDCCIYIVTDITRIRQELNALVVQLGLICLLVIVVGVGLVSAAVQFSLKPLGQLQKTAAGVASGNYALRSQIDTTDEVGLLAADFNRMAGSIEKHIGELARKNEDQRRFIGDVTHEFKTPLTSLLLNIDSLQNTYLEEDEQAAVLSNMQRQCSWLEAMVQKLLKMITLEGSLTLQEASVPALLESVSASLSPLLREKGVGLEIECEMDMLPMDFDLMQSALCNLVENAVKASAPGQTVSLRASGDTIEVRDEGIGMPPEALDRITEPFYMIDKSRSKRSGGVGLGLALTKEIIDRHGAALAFESAPGQGTTAMIRFGNQTVTAR